MQKTNNLQDLFLLRARKSHASLWRRRGRQTKELP